MQRIKQCSIIVFTVFLLYTSVWAADIPDQVIAGGYAIGLSLESGGVTVTEIPAQSSSPAASAGIQVGDRILAIDGTPIQRAEEIPTLLANKRGAAVDLTVQRSGAEPMQIRVEPILDGTVWKLGLLVKDRINGIGTLTYYDAESGRFGALGHAVNAPQSAETRPQTGEIIPVEIVEIRRGSAGEPGSLIGTNQDAEAIGSVDRNVPQGVFGSLNEAPMQGRVYPVATAEELRQGPATILCTLQGNRIKAYAVEITEIRLQDPKDRNLKLRVTDQDLLDEAGGIVQGISGAPILQDGKIIGAVTHVLVDRPDWGYGIYIGNMLRADAAA